MVTLIHYQLNNSRTRTRGTATVETVAIMITVLIF